MKITLDLHVSSATLGLAVKELKRQWDAMNARYPEMVIQGKIGGAESERRLFAHRVAMEAVADLQRLLYMEERATEDFGPRDDGEDGQ